MFQPRLLAVTATVFSIAVDLPMAAASFVDDRIGDEAVHCPYHAPERTSYCSVLAFIDTKRRPFTAVTNVLNAPTAFVRNDDFVFERTDHAKELLKSPFPDMTTADKPSEDKTTANIRFSDIEMDDESAYETTTVSINHKNSYELMMESQAAKLELGTRVAVQWRTTGNKGQYYEAIVKEINSLHFVYVEYKVDGFLEWIDTRKDRFQIIGGPSENMPTKWTQVQMQDLIQSALY